MRILIGQPVHEENIEQLENEIIKNPIIDYVLYPEGYLVNEGALENARVIAKKYGKTIITGYRSNNSDRAVIINNLGEKILERAKTPVDQELYMPSAVEHNGVTIGYLLCREILKGFTGLESIKYKINFIAHPIGVGMFSDEQFNEWINEAKTIAKKYKTIIIGTSHADGSYRNCGISLPISYFIDENGQEIFISKSDVRTRIINLKTKEVIIMEG